MSYPIGRIYHPGHISLFISYLASENLRSYSGALKFNPAMKIPHYFVYIRSRVLILMISDEFILKH